MRKGRAIKMKFYNLVLALLCLLSWSALGALEDDRSRVSIGYYAPGTGKSRPWLSVIVKFDGKPSAEEYNNYYEYISARLSDKLIGTDKRSDSILFKLKERSVTNPEFQKIINEANLFFDPVEVKKREDTRLRLEKEKEAKEAEEKAAAEREMSRKADEARLKREAEEKAKEEQKIIAKKRAEEAWLKSEAEKKRIEEQRRAWEEKACDDCDSYSVQALPSGFSLGGLGSRVLNNRGQVCGYIGNFAQGQTTAACWSTDRMITINRSESFANAINDDGLCAVTAHDLNKKNVTKVLLWNTNNGKVQYGPFGHADAINDTGVVRIYDADDLQKLKLWDTNENMIDFYPSSPRGIDLWNPYVKPCSHNKNGASLIRKTDLYLSYQGKNKLLLPLDSGENISTGCLNDNNEVIALTVMDAPKQPIFKKDEKLYRITKWQKNGVASASELFNKISVLKNYYSFVIKGFNNSGQVLLEASAKQFGQSKQLFLLTLITK
jgi:hypothetical protein